MTRQARATAAIASAVSLTTLAAAVGCAGGAASTVYADAQPISLGAGDHVGARIRTTEIAMTGRDAWDRDQLLAAEAVRLAELLEMQVPTDGDNGATPSPAPSLMVSEPIDLDAAN